MPHVIYGARLYFVCSTLLFMYTKLVPLSGYYTNMITTTGQCALDNGGKGGRAIVISW